MKYLFFILTFTLLSCKKDTFSYPQNTLEVIYSKPGIFYPMSMGCGWPKNIDSIDRTFKYLKIYDEESVDEFFKLYNKYEIDSTNFGADVRIQILVHQSVKTDTLCLGEYFGTIRNGQSMKDSKELLNFIKKRVHFDGK